jgi:broad specificity phosphatase PhoE
MTEAASMKPTLVLVRHGETEGQSSIRYYGRSDLALSDLGRRQMRAVARVLAARPFGIAFSSPLRRASEGARLIGGEEVPLIEVPEFIEIDFGIFEGLTADEIQQRHPEEFVRWQSNRLADGYFYPQGESRSAFVNRVRSGIEKMLTRWTELDSKPGGSALLVAHRGVIRAIVKALVIAEPMVELASIQILERDGNRWLLRTLDQTDHLQALDS